MTRWVGVLGGIVGLVSTWGCESMRQPQPLAGQVSSPAIDGGEQRPDGSPDASSSAKTDGLIQDAGDARADANGRDAGAADDAGPANPRTPDGGSVDAATTGSGLVSTIVAENVGTIDALAIDGATLYGLTNTNILWVLDPGSAMPRPLAQDATPVGSSCGHDSRLTLNASDLFWLALPTDSSSPLPTVLHRTERSGAGDTLMATGIPAAPYPMVAADDTHVYWIEEALSSDGNPGGVVRSLPVDAAPGMAPTTMVPVTGAYDILAMTAAEETLYWVSAFSYTTVPKPQLDAEAVSDLLASQPPTPTNLGESWWAYPHDGDLYVSASPAFEQLDLARRSPDGSIVKLAPVQDADNIVFVDDWALVSVPSGTCGNHHHQLVAIPTATPGGPVVQLADDLGTPAVLGTELAFVDLAGQVHISTLD